GEALDGFVRQVLQPPTRSRRWFDQMTSTLISVLLQTVSLAAGDRVEIEIEAARFEPTKGTEHRVSLPPGCFDEFIGRRASLGGKTIDDHSELATRTRRGSSLHGLGRQRGCRFPRRIRNCISRFGHRVIL